MFGEQRLCLFNYPEIRPYSSLHNYARVSNWYPLNGLLRLIEKVPQILDYIHGIFFRINCENASLIPRPLLPEKWPGTHCLHMCVIICYILHKEKMCTFSPRGSCIHNVILTMKYGPFSPVYTKWMRQLTQPYLQVMQRQSSFDQKGSYKIHMSPGEPQEVVTNLPDIQSNRKGTTFVHQYLFVATGIHLSLPICDQFLQLHMTATLPTSDTTYIISGQITCKRKSCLCQSTLTLTT